MSKLAVVTGGTKGIGRAIVEEFASLKFDIATCSRHHEDLEVLKSHLAKTFSVRTHSIVADLSVRDQVRKFSDFVTGLGQPVDVLVNNAGFFAPGQIMEEKEGALEALIEANVYSAYHLTRGLCPAMKAEKAGHIFNMCSIASIKAYPNGGSYAISKFALLGFSKVLREELKEFNIRVTAVLPGATRTGSWDGVQLPDERFIMPRDVAKAVAGAWSLSPQSVVEEIIIRPQLGDI